MLDGRNERSLHSFGIVRVSGYLCMLMWIVNKSGRKRFLIDKGRIIRCVVVLVSMFGFWKVISRGDYLINLLSVGMWETIEIPMSCVDLRSEFRHITG